MTVVLWDAGAFHAKASWKHRERGGPMFVVAYSPDGRTIVTCAADRFVRLWDAETGNSVKQLPHASGASSADFNRAGTMLVTGGGNQTAILWDLSTYNQPVPPLHHKRNVKLVQFSRDGELLLTNNRGGASRLWDVATGKPIGPVLTFPGGGYEVALWPDEKHVIIEAGGEVVYWQIPQPKEGPAEEIRRRIEVITGLELAVNKAERMLTTAEWIERRKQLDRIRSAP